MAIGVIGESTLISTITETMPRLICGILALFLEDAQ